jgi:Domain of unknown function (DUF6487)
MRCPNCGENMEAGYVMVMGGSALRWYDKDEKQHKILGALGGHLMVEANLTHQYLPAHRCYGCNSFLMSMDSAVGGYDQAAMDKAK